MGFRFRLLLVAAPLGLAAPVLAQQADAPSPGFQLPPATTAPAPDPDRQGPELDVYRDTTPPRAAPPVIAPTVTPAPAPAQAGPTPQPSQQNQQNQQRPAPAQPRATRPADAERPAPANPAATAPVDDATTTDAPAPAPAAPVADTPAPATPQPTAPEPVAKAADASPLPWIIGGALALLALAAFTLLRRRRPVEAVEPVAEAAPVEAPPAPTPVAASVAPPAPPAPEPAPSSTADRPWLAMDLAVAQARYSLVGVTIAYSLLLHNRGTLAAQDILVRGILGNGGAQQQALLEAFFGGQDGLPLHSAVSIAPGETRQISGELRLSPDQIVPVEMGQRRLLIPIAAFDTSYRWEADGDATGAGRTARAFVVGQEQDPPADRLAPLRLDQGPRQYRRPAARAAAELTPA